MADAQSRLTHIGASGEAHMVDVGAKAETERTAIAEGAVTMLPETLQMILDGDAKKGDVLGAARIAGIMAAKKTHELIPLCHPLLLDQGFRRHRAGRRRCPACASGRSPASPARPASKWRR